MDTILPVCFTPQQMEAFASLSQDRNPLHTDALYARATPFGRPVVYGMAAVVLALGQWAKARVFSLDRIKGTFPKPLFRNEPYTLKISESEASVNVQYLRGCEVECSFSFTGREG